MKEYFLLVFYGIVIGVIGFSLLLLVERTREQSYGLQLPSGTAIFETSLQNRITSTDTSMTLVSTSTRGGGSLSGYQCFVVDEGRSDAEFVCGTLTAAKTVSSLTRGIDPRTGSTTNASLQFAHRVGANVKITDFPLIQNMKSILNGEDTIPNLLTYSDMVLCGVGSATTTVCPKAYIDSVAVAGASNANETTKGIVELATQVQMASSTLTDTTAANLALYSKYSTSTPYKPDRLIPITQLNGMLNDLFMPTTTSKTWGALHLFQAGASTTRFSIFDTVYVGGAATSTIQGTVAGTSTLQGYFNVLGANSTSTFSGALEISKSATTTNLTVSGALFGGPMTYTGSSTNSTVSSGSPTTCTSCIPTTANIALVKYTITAGTTGQGVAMLTRNGMNSIVVTFSDDDGNTTNADYAIAWSGSDMTFTEQTDDSSSFNATVYYYK